MGEVAGLCRCNISDDELLAELSDGAASAGDIPGWNEFADELRTLDNALLAKLREEMDARSKTPNAAGNRLARQGQSELTGLLGPGSEAR